MKQNIKFVYLVFLSALLLALLAACGGSRVKFVAPEIDPPADLIPAYVPEGFELIKGYQIEVGEFERDFFQSDDNEDRRILCDLELPDLLFELKSPAGNDILGVHYQDGDHLLLISKSYYPGGSLDLWQAAFEGNSEEEQDCECDCGCGCIALTIDGLPFPLRSGEVEEVRTVGDSPVAVLDGLLGTTTVFMRGDYLLTVESDISLEENLKVVESLLQ